MAVDFFVSYASPDEAWAEWVAWVLEESGSSVVLQAWDFRPGSNFPLEMQRASASARRTIAILSPDYLKSRFAAPEWTAAFAQDPEGIKRLLIPVRVRDCQLEGLLRTIVHIELVGLGEAAARKTLLDGLSTARAKPAQPPAFPGPTGARQVGIQPRPFPGDTEASDGRFGSRSARAVPVEPDPEKGDDRGVELPPKPVFYDLPSLPDRYQAREDDLGKVRGTLLEGNAPVGIVGAARAIGLSGMGGLGKTVLATALVYDPRVRAAFSDGIVWLTFGREVSVLEKAAELAYVLTTERANFHTASEARGQLGLYTAAKRLLVVLDDVWEPAAVDSFAGLGAGCRLLITTRDNRVLARVRADGHQIELLDPDSARAFLSEATDIGIEALPTVADQIVHECGRLPLALAAVGAMIRRRIFNWSDALKALHDKGLEHLDTSWLPDPEQRSLAVVLKLSVDALSDEMRVCFLDCACLRGDVDIPEATLFLLWSDRQPDELERKLFAQELVDRSVVRRDEHRRYRIHDLYMAYLRHAAAPLIERHQHLVERYWSASPGGLANCPDDGYCLQHIAWHLSEAGNTTELRLLLFDLVWIRRRIPTGLPSFYDDYKLLAGDREASQLAAALTPVDIHVTDPDVIIRLDLGAQIARLLDTPGYFPIRRT